MTMGDQPTLLLQSVSIRYGGVTAVDGASFSVREGEFVTLLGPSGSGKTTLLRAIAGFVRPDAGEILLKGERLNDKPPFEREMGVVFQNYALFPHMSVTENIGFGLRMRRVGRSEIAGRVEEALRGVRLEGYGARRIHQLSGGQQQRVAIARALVIRPDILLLDEPLSNLDAQLRAAMQVELLEIVRRTGVTAIFVTHSQEEALSMSDRVVVMASGKIRQIGTPAEIYRAPADGFVAGFIGQSNILSAEILGAESGRLQARAGWGGILTLAGTAASGGALSLLLRPEQVQLGSAPSAQANCFAGRVRHIQFLGAALVYRVALGEHEIIVHCPATSGIATPAIGDAVWVSWDESAMTAIGA